MADRFEFFEHTADIGVHVYGASLPELFQNAAAALYEALGELRKAESGKRKGVKLEASSLEDLLHDWLTELLYEVEVNHFQYDGIASLSVCGSGVPAATGIEATVLSGEPNRGGDAAPTFWLLAELCDGAIDFSRSQTNEEIKAVTYHQLHVEQLPDSSWRATVIFDV